MENTILDSTKFFLVPQCTWKKKKTQAWEEIMVPTLSRDLKHLLLVIFVVDKHHPTANFTVQCPLNNHPKCTIVLKLEKVCTLQNLKAVEKRFTSQYLVNTHPLQIL